MNFMQAKKKGLAIDTIAGIIISMVILELISWLLKITGNSFYLIPVVGYAAVILICVFVFIEWNWCPVIIKFLYRAEFEKEKQELWKNFKHIVIGR